MRFFNRQAAPSGEIHVHVGGELSPAEAERLRCQWLQRFEQSSAPPRRRDWLIELLNFRLPLWAWFGGMFAADLIAGGLSLIVKVAF